MQYPCFQLLLKNYPMLLNLPDVPLFYSQRQYSSLPMLLSLHPKQLPEIP